MEGQSRPTDKLKFIESKKKIRVENKIVQPHVKLITAANKHNLAIIGCEDNTIKFIETSHLFDFTANQPQVINQPATLLASLTFRPTLLCVARYGYSSVLLISGVGSFPRSPVIEVYDLDSRSSIGLLNLNDLGEAEIVDYAWHPNYYESIVALCTSKGHLLILAINKKNKSIGIVYKSEQYGALTCCWSMKGKNLAIGTLRGQIMRLEPVVGNDSFSFKEVNGSTITFVNPKVTADHQLVRLRWINQKYLMATHARARDPSNPETVYSILTVKPDKPYLYWTNVNIENQTKSNYVVHVANLSNSVVCISSATGEAATIGVLGANEATTNELNDWSSLIIEEEGARIELPLDANNGETQPCGLTMTTWPQDGRPILIFYTNDGLICSYAVMHSDNILKFPEHLNQPEKEFTFKPKPAAPATNLGLGGASAAPSFGGMGALSNPSFGGKAVLSAPSFGGTATLSNLSFGGTAALTSPSFGGAATLSSPSFGGTATLASPSFGGTATLTTPSFGGAANLSSPSFGGTATLTAPSLGGAVNLSSPSFGGAATLTSPSFGGTATLTSPSFGGAANLSSPSFGGTATLTGPSLGGAAKLSSPSFGGNNVFSGTSFGGKAVPSTPSISETANLSSPSLGGKAVLSGLSLGGKGVPSTPSLDGAATLSGPSLGSTAALTGLSFGGAATLSSPSLGGKAVSSGLSFGGIAGLSTPSLGGAATLSGSSLTGAVPATMTSPSFGGTTTPSSPSLGGKAVLSGPSFGGTAKPAPPKQPSPTQQQVASISAVVNQIRQVKEKLDFNEAYISLFEELNHLRDRFDETIDLHRAHHDALDAVRGDIDHLDLEVLETFYLIEYVKSRISCDIKKKSIDPITTKKVNNIKMKLKQIASKLEELSDHVDVAWEDFVRRRSTRERRSISLDAIYKALATNQKIINVLKKKVEFEPERTVSEPSSVVKKLTHVKRVDEDNLSRFEEFLASRSVVPVRQPVNLA